MASLDSAFGAGTNMCAHDPTIRRWAHHDGVRNMSSPVEVENVALSAVVDPGAELEQLGSGCTWAEGPVYLPDEEVVLCSDIPNDRIMCWSADSGFTEYRTGVEYTNGHTLDLEGRLVSCSHGHRRIERTESDGSIVTVVDHYQGRRLNSPNDLVVKSDGTIWFSDPPYGIASDHEGHKADSEIDDCYVYRFDPADGSLVAVTDVIEEPNGLAFSPDESLLYVSDTSAAFREDELGNHHIMTFDVIGGRALNNPRLFAEVSPGLSDGFRVTTEGHVLTSAADGIHIYSPDATRLGKILTPEPASNCAFGGPTGTRLFITASSSLHAIDLKLGCAERGAGLS